MDAPPPEVSSAVQDYLKAIYALEAAGARATTSALAARLNVSAPSVTQMAKRLAELGLVERKPYHGVVLTETGRRGALEVLRHHRLLELYLVDTLGLALDVVHAEADRLEHVLSEELEARIDEALGFPTHDPHGDPIPDRELQLEHVEGRTIMDLAPGERTTVTRVPDADPELLRYLGELALVPGGAVELASLAPFDGPATVRSASGEHAISRRVAATIGVA
jgi:DtxR family Mn-dependent transcriptional regulator